MEELDLKELLYYYLKRMPIIILTTLLAILFARIFNFSSFLSNSFLYSINFCGLSKSFNFSIFFIYNYQIYYSIY